MTDREPEDDDRDDDEEDDEEEESPPPAKAKSKATESKAGGSSAKPSDSSVSAKPAPVMVPSSRALAIGIVALVVGVAVGWFGQIQKSKAAVRAEVTAAPAGSAVPSGPCGTWQWKICASSGEQSVSCQQAKGAAELLLPSTCESALGTLPETLAKVKAARASCEKLVTKICADLSPGSKTCDMVKERTPSFPRERCDQMLQSYDKVIGELKQMDQQGGTPMGAGHMQSGGMPPGAMPPGAMPPGAIPPGGMPHSAMPHITLPQTPPKP